jgi:hypothetical protein
MPSEQEWQQIDQLNRQVVGLPQPIWAVPFAGVSMRAATRKGDPCLPTP